MEIAGLTAVVTGASGRLGGAIALGLAEAGMDCICHCGRNVEKADKIASQITALGRRATVIQVNLAKEDEIKKLFDAAGVFGRVRVLINSASVFGRYPLTELTGQAVQTTLAVNLVAPMLASHYFVRRLQAEGLDWKAAETPFAKIVNLADVAVTRPWAEYAAYCASKAGLVGLTTALAKELAPGITVNAVAPGIVTWPEPMGVEEERKQLARIPAGRFGRPAEIVKSIVFLLENDYISGQTLAVDGGRSI